MDNKAKEYAAQVIPAVRALLTRNGCVAFDAREAAAGVPGGVTTDIRDLEEFCAFLRDISENAPQALIIKGVGSFFPAECKRGADERRARFLNHPAPPDVPKKSGRMAGKLVLITGAAGGFGLGLSRNFAAEGAYVLMADMNLEKTVEQAARLNSEFGSGTAMPLQMDVADPCSTQEALNAGLLEYGGLDAFISCAGIVRSGGLEHMELSDFELVTKVNYTSFFIGVKYVSRIFKLEHHLDPGFTSDIIQINSKSGLDGSVNNFAYAGSKFGGIGLVQSFAKELVPHGVKVNAVCPGNYYGGPLWNDPEKGLFVQYLHTGKVPGAKTVEDVRRYHEEKTPMGRGCEPDDVTRAVFYCIEQQYETGQALPVSGGQIMLK